MIKYNKNMKVIYNFFTFKFLEWIYCLIIFYDELFSIKCKDDQHILFSNYFHPYSTSTYKKSSFKLNIKLL